MLVTQDALQSSRLALLSAALESVFRAAREDGFDGLSVEASIDGDVSAIDLTYIKAGVPVTGMSL